MSSLIGMTISFHVPNMNWLRMKVFHEYPKWRAEETIELAENGAAYLSVISSSPDLLKGVKPERIANYQKSIRDCTEEVASVYAIR
ncbi:aminopeptidase [Peribacillus frigoritolerans]|nr:aminopeptidase [Peribacillus frigoritolerans]